MRIAILGHFPVDAPPTGGVQSVIANLRDALARREGIELHLIQHRRGVPVGTFPREKWTEHNLPARDSRIIPNMIRTAALLRPLLTELQPDVVSTHQPEYAAAALEMGLPTLHTIHGFPGDEFWKRKGFFTRSAMLLEAWQERQTLRRARHLVAISDMVIARYRGRTRAVFHRIDNPVSPIFFQPAPPPDPRQLLLVGNLTPVKDIDTAVRAISLLLPRFPRLRLVIVGRESDPAYAARVRALAAPLGQAVVFRGPVSQAEVKALLDASLALVLTSHQEHAPMIVSEALAAARPVVATRVGALTGMVEDGRTGYLVDAGDARATAAALARLLDDPDQARDMGTRGAKVARERYHPDAVAEAYLQAMHAAMTSA